MKRTLVHAIVVSAFVALAGAVGAQSPTPSFRFERPIAVPADGPHRLPIDVSLLTGGSPFRVASRPVFGSDASTTVSFVASDGLSDLRLFHASGQEVGYLLVPPPSAQRTWRPPTTVLPVPAVDTEKQRTSGFEVDLGTAVAIDRIRLAGLPAPFVKRVRLEGSGDRERWTSLVEEGTVFDLPESDLRQLELSFTASSLRYLRFVWDDRQTARLTQAPRVSVRDASSVSSPVPLTAPVVFERRPSEPRRSRFHVRLPASRMPIAALSLDVAGARVLRQIEVFESRVSGAGAEPARIGQGTLKRVEQNGLTAAAVRVPIQPPVEAELDLVVDDGDNPPLEVRGMSVELAELPWIYFEAPAGTLTARYGDARLSAPRYDLEATRATVRIDTVPDATWGEAQSRTGSDQATIAPPLPTIGATVDANTFRFSRTVAAGEAGLVAVRLDAAALAHAASSAPRFRDLRLVDTQGRQIPYLIERVAEPLSLELTATRLESRPESLGRARPGESVYRVDLPHANLPAPRLVLKTSARVFTRPLRVVVSRPPNRRHRDPWAEVMGTAVWSHVNQDAPAIDFELPLPTVDQKELLLVIDEGDNTPLPLAGVRALLPAYRLRFFREQMQALRLVYGRDDIAAPTYDLALLSSRLMGASAIEVSPEPERDQQPDRMAPSGAPFSSRLFWGILIGAVVVLVALIGRLIRTPPSDQP